MCFLSLQETAVDGCNKRGKSKNCKCPAKMSVFIQLRTSKDLYAKVQWYTSSDYLKGIGDIVTFSTILNTKYPHFLALKLTLYDCKYTMS